MSLLERFARYAADFEKTYRDDDWSRLEEYFTDDATYAVENMPFAFRAEGRDRVLAAIRRSVSGFDRKLERQVELREAPREEGNRVVVPWKARYEGEGRAPLEFAAEEVAVFEGDRIRHLEDVYDEAAAGVYEAWMREHGEGLDVSYE